MVGIKCNTTKKREAYPYRDKYFKHNPGLFGKRYYCSQCGKRLTKEEMDVDHIIPLAKWYGFNRVFNTVAICHECNLKKGSKLTPKFLLKGIAAKTLEETGILTQKILLLSIDAIHGIPKLLLSPFISKDKMDDSFLYRGFVLSAYILILYAVWNLV